MAGAGSLRAPGLLLVDIDDVRCAFPVEGVAEVLPAARVDPLPDAPDAVMGVLNVRGEPVVVIDGHRCLNREALPLRPSDRFVVLHEGEPRLAVRVDHVHDVCEITEGHLAPELVLGPHHAQTVVLLADGVLVIRDPATFVSASDAVAIATALDRMRVVQG